MEREDCKYFDGCSAPLCPLNKDSLINCTWFPGEDICKAHQNQFIKTQKKIQKKTQNFEDGCFHFRMLNRNFVVASGIKGIDPELLITDDKHDFGIYDKWNKQHPEISDERKQKLASHGFTKKGDSMQDLFDE